MITMHLVDASSSVGYIVLFALIAGESAGLPIPGETALTTAAVLAAQGHLNLAIVLTTAATAAIIGDNIGYLIGRHAGPWLFLRHGRLAAQRRRILHTSQAFFRTHAALPVFIGRWLPILRFTAAIFAGANTMPWRSFALWNTLGGTCWALSIGTLAYTIGTQADNAIQTIGAISAISLTLILTGHLTWRHIRTTPTQPGPHPANNTPP